MKIMLFSFLSMLLAMLTVVTAFGVIVLGFHGYSVAEEKKMENDKEETKEITVRTDFWKLKKQLEKQDEEQWFGSLLNPEDESAMRVGGIVADAKNLFRILRKYQVGLVSGVLFTIFLGFGSFLFYFQLFTKKMSGYLSEISDGIDEIAKGNFYESIPVQGEDEFANIAEKLNSMKDELQMRMENERRYEKEKNDLITNVAHDLRTPLTSVIGYLDLVRTKEHLSREDKRHYIEVTYEKAKRLERLIEELFEFTKVGAERRTIKVTIFDFRCFLQQMLDEFYPSFQDAELECIVEEEFHSGRLEGDADLLARGISNLLSNAVKYGKDGKILKINVREDNKKEMLHFSITNFGEIIPEEDLEHIFDKFFRVETSRSVETGGTGLGLAIAKKVILLHHGTIRVTSNYRGTVFSVTLPLKQQEQEEEYE